MLSIKNLLQFKPCRPKTWPRLPKLLLTLVTSFILLNSKLSSNYRRQLVIFILSLVATIVIKIKSLINERLERHKIFDLGKVPSVGRTNVFTGNLFELMAPVSNIQIQYHYHLKMGKTYGFFYGPDPWVFTVDLDLLNRIFITEGSQHIDRAQLRMPFMTEFNKSLAQARGDLWRRQRRTLDPFFTSRSMKKDNVYDDISRSCDRFVDSIQQHPIDLTAGADGKASRIIDVNESFKRFSLDVVLRVAFGVPDAIDLNPNSRLKLMEVIEEGSTEIRCIMVWVCIALENFERLIGQLTKFSKLNEYRKYIHGILEDSMAKRRLVKDRIEQHDRRMIDTILECLDSNKFDLESINSNLFFIFLAGFETTANTLAILFHCLARHGEIQEKLRDSILVDGEKSQYMDWCIKETLRLHPAVPGAVGRVLEHDLEHNGMTFFKGTTILASIYTIHRLKEYWGPDHDEFRPERFGQIKLHPAQFFAFGLGPRYCIGQNLAMAELRSIVSKLLTKYRVEECPTTPKVVPTITPNIIHMIIEGKLNLRFVELSSL